MQLSSAASQGLGWRASQQKDLPASPNRDKSWEFTFIFHIAGVQPKQLESFQGIMCASLLPRPTPLCLPPTQMGLEVSASLSRERIHVPGMRQLWGWKGTFLGKSSLCFGVLSERRTSEWGSHCKECSSGSDLNLCSTNAQLWRCCWPLPVHGAPDKQDYG